MADCEHKGCVGRRVCRSAQKAAYRASHRAEIAAYDAKWRASHKAEIAAQRVVYQATPIGRLNGLLAMSRYRRKRYVAQFESLLAEYEVNRV